jgi:CheY-like chemotaxis protein
MTDRSQPGSAQPAPRRAGCRRSAIRRVLQTEGYAVLEAPNGAVALELLTASEAAGVDLLATIRNQLRASDHRARQRPRTDPKGSEV